LALYDRFRQRYPLAPVTTSPFSCNRHRLPEYRQKVTGHSTASQNKPIYRPSGFLAQRGFNKAPSYNFSALTDLCRGKPKKDVKKLWEVMLHTYLSFALIQIANHSYKVV
jgi:hypothetical protein